MPSVLVVDDDPDIRELLCTVFTGAGMAVMAVADGATALRTATQSCPDAVVADVDMPDMTGMQLNQAMRNDDQLRSVPLVIVTGYLVAGGSEVREVGSCTVVFQPGSNKELVAAVSTLIGREQYHQDPLSQWFSSNDMTTVATKVTEVVSLMFSPPYADLSTPWPLFDGEDDASHEPYSPALPLPEAHPCDPRFPSRSWRFSARGSAATWWGLESQYGRE